MSGFGEATGRINPAVIDRVMRISESEPDGDHWLSHFVLARKVLGESAGFAIRVANAFKHRRLTRAECEGMVSDWLTDESERFSAQQEAKSHAG